MLILCKFCKESFNIKESRADRTKFCSRKCQENYFNENYFKLLIDRINGKCTKNICWEWTGNKDKYGYGYLTIMKPNKHKEHAHRASYMAYNKLYELPPILHICHSCHNRLCVNPEHLHLGTPKDNIDEMVDANRQAKGSNLPQAILNEQQVQDILAARSSGISVKFLANKYNLTLSSIYNIFKKKTWKHVHS